MESLRLENLIEKNCVMELTKKRFKRVHIVIIYNNNVILNKTIFSFILNENKFVNRVFFLIRKKCNYINLSTLSVQRFIKKFYNIVIKKIDK